MSERLGAAISRIARSPYGQAVAVLSGAQAVSAGIPILAAPLLGRLYRPEDYGMLALTVAFSAILAGASTLQFHSGIQAVRSSRQSNALAGLSLAVSLGFTVIAMLFALLAKWWLNRDGAYGSEINWLLLIPLMTLMASVSLTADTVLSRHQMFGSMARLNVFATCLSVFVTIGFGLLSWGVAGVMLGAVVGEAVKTWGYIRALRRLVVRPFGIGLRGLARLGLHHKDFPIFGLPATILASTTLQVPVFAIGWLGSPVILGSFSRAQRLVALPLLFVGTSIGQVFRQRASEQWRQSGTCRPVYWKTAAALAAVSGPPLVLLYCCGPVVFRFVLGPDWGEAGRIASILAPMVFLRTVASPLENVFLFTGQQRVFFRLHLTVTALTVMGVAIPLALGRGGMAVIEGFAIANSVAWIVSLALSWRCSARE